MCLFIVCLLCDLQVSLWVTHSRAMEIISTTLFNQITSINLSFNLGKFYGYTDGKSQEKWDTITKLLRQNSAEEGRRWKPVKRKSWLINKTTSRQQPSQLEEVPKGGKKVIGEGTRGKFFLVESPRPLIVRTQWKVRTGFSPTKKLKYFKL